MTTLMQASRQWASRPDDQRFINLLELNAFCENRREKSQGKVVSSRKIEFRPDPNDNMKGLQVFGPNGVGFNPTHHSFRQLAHLGGASSATDYLRGLPSVLAADCLNYGFKIKRDIEDVGVLLYKDGDYNELSAATGPNYGRVWNADLTNMCVDRFGDGITGYWKVPGEFGKDVEVNKRNTTLFASDRDMFIFLADEKRKIEVKDRRDGKSGQMSRGFFLWNSETGNRSLGAAFFIFDYVCCNRIVWGAEQFQEIRINHTSSAPDRYLEEITPVLEDYSTSSPKPILQAIEHAKQKRLDMEVEDFLKNRFSRGQIAAIVAAHEVDEQKPIETVWDAVTGITAYARSIKWQDKRVEIEREAGKLLKAAA